MLPYQISHMEERVNVKEQLVLDLQKRSKVGAWRRFVWAHVLFNYFFGTVPFISYSEFDDGCRNWRKH